MSPYAKRSRGRRRSLHGRRHRPLGPNEFYNVKTKGRVTVKPSEVERGIRRGQAVFDKAKDPKSGIMMWKITGRAR